MAKLGSTVDARLSRISPQAIRAIERGGAAMGGAYASIGASAAKAITSYADMKKEQRLTDEEKEEEVQKDKRAINYIRGIVNPDTGVVYTAGEARDIVKAIGPDKALSQIAAQKNVDKQIKATSDLAQADRIAAAQRAQASDTAGLISSINGQVTQLNIAIGDNKSDLEIAKLRNADETQKQVYLARIDALQASIKVLTDKSGAIEANNKLLIDGRTALQNIANPSWMAKASPEEQTEAYNTVKEAQAGFVGEHYGNFEDLIGWNKTKADGSIVREEPSSWIKLRASLEQPDGAFGSNVNGDGSPLDDGLAAAKDGEDGDGGKPVALYPKPDPWKPVVKGVKSALDTLEERNENIKAFKSFRESIKAAAETGEPITPDQIDYYKNLNKQDKDKIDRSIDFYGKTWEDLTPSGSIIFP
jgi:hypothetical protein